VPTSFDLYVSSACGQLYAVGTWRRWAILYVRRIGVGIVVHSVCEDVDY
jgi:hypothetical protein